MLIFCLCFKGKVSEWQLFHEIIKARKSPTRWERITHQKPETSEPENYLQWQRVIFLSSLPVPGSEAASSVFPREAAAPGETHSEQRTCYVETVFRYITIGSLMRRKSCSNVHQEKAAFKMRGILLHIKDIFAVQMKNRGMQGSLFLVLMFKTLHSILLKCLRRNNGTS